VNPFEQLTLKEAEDMAELCYPGKAFEDVSPFTFAGAVLFMHKRRENPLLEWESFRSTVSMHEIGEVSEAMSPDKEPNPTNGVSANV
jgi:hypothetical protein